MEAILNINLADKIATFTYLYDNQQNYFAKIDYRNYEYSTDYFKKYDPNSIDVNDLKLSFGYSPYQRFIKGFPSDKEKDGLYLQTIKTLCIDAYAQILSLFDDQINAYIKKLGKKFIGGDNACWNITIFIDNDKIYLFNTLHLSTNDEVFTQNLRKSFMKKNKYLKNYSSIVPDWANTSTLEGDIWATLSTQYFSQQKAYFKKDDPIIKNNSHKFCYALSNDQLNEKDIFINYIDTKRVFTDFVSNKKTESFMFDEKGKVIYSTMDLAIKGMLNAVNYLVNRYIKTILKEDTIPLKMYNLTKLSNKDTK